VYSETEHPKFVLIFNGLKLTVTVEFPPEEVLKVIVTGFGDDPATVNAVFPVVSV
jgi:hypothetical protein